MRNLLSSIVVVAAAGCTGRASAPVPATPVAISNQVEASASGDAAAIDPRDGARLWRALAPTGADWEQRVALVTDPAARRAMAVSLLLAGDLECHEVVEQYGCSEEWLEHAPLSPGATFDDPCLRRVLAGWALGQLTADDVREVEHVLVELVAMPEPERDLQDAAFAAAADDALRLRLLAAAPEAIAERHAGSLTTTDAGLRALRGLGLDGAAAAIDWTDHERELIDALEDPDLTGATRLGLLAELDGRHGDAVRDVLVRLTGDADCAIAMAAAAALADRGDPSHLPRRPASRDPEAHARALCVLQHDADVDRRDETWRAWIGDAGVERVHETEWDDAAATTDHEARADSRFEVSAPDAWSCSGLTCSSSGGWSAFEVELQPAGASLEIVRVTTSSYSGCGC